MPQRSTVRYKLTCILHSCIYGPIQRLNAHQVEWELGDAATLTQIVALTSSKQLFEACFVTDSEFIRIWAFLQQILKRILTKHYFSWTYKVSPSLSIRSYNVMVIWGVDVDHFWQGLPSQKQSKSKSTPRVTMMLLIHKGGEIFYFTLHNMEFYTN